MYLYINIITDLAQFMHVNEYGVCSPIWFNSLKGHTHICEEDFKGFCHVTLVR